MASARMKFTFPMIDFQRASEVLQPQVCYSLQELNEALPELCIAELMDARRNGLIDGLGFGPQTHLLGADVLRFLEEKTDGGRRSTASIG